MASEELLNLVETLIKDLAKTQREVEALKAHSKASMMAFHALVSTLETEGSLKRDKLVSVMSAVILVGEKNGADENALVFLRSLRDAAFQEFQDRGWADKAH